MADDSNSLVLELLRAIRVDLGDMRDDMREVKGRLTSLEVSVANLHRDFAGQSGRIDRVENRLERIEQRLDLRDALAGVAAGLDFRAALASSCCCVYRAHKHENDAQCPGITTLETRTPAEREKALIHALPQQVANARENAPFFKEWLKDVDPASVISRAALARLLVLRKAMLGDVQRQSPGG